MQAPFPIHAAVRPINSTGLVPLRHAADRRSLIFLILLTTLYTIQWTGLCRSWLLLPFTCVFAFIACVIKHNHIHCRTFTSRRWNRLMDYWLGACTGQPTAAIIAVHNERHHAQNHSDQDCVRSTLVNFRANWLNLLAFTLVAVWQVYHIKSIDARRWQISKPSMYRRLISERIVVLTLIAILLLLDWRATLLYLGIPWLFGQWGIVAINLLQHQDCDHDSDFDHSRNITGRFINWLFLNNGYHTAHHLRPALHWSLLPEFHRQSIAPYMRPELNRSSLLLSIWAQFFTTRLQQPHHTANHQVKH